MRLDGKNLAVHPEAADAIDGTILKTGEQSIGILHAQTAQLLQRVRPLHPTDGRGRRGDEFDRLVTKHAAEAKPNHAHSQFIAVMLSCSTVAIATQIK